MESIELGQKGNAGIEEKLPIFTIWLLIKGIVNYQGGPNVL